MSKIFFRMIGLAIPLLTIASLTISAHAQTLTTEGDGAGVSGHIDCTEVSVDYMDDPTLTDAEKLALMDQALQSSLNKYDACQTSKASSNAGGGGGGSGGGGDNGKQGSGESNADSGVGSSTASSDMSGTEQPKTPEPVQAQGGSAGNSSWTNPAPEPVETKTENEVPGQKEAGNEQPSGQDTGKKPLDNGKLPEDIPPADNDSILEAQIRQAAINEKDPVVQKRLWNEYRKYKGLPQVK